MGHIRLRYRIKEAKIDIKSIVHEIEYGSTFALYNTHEEVFPCNSDILKWTDWRQEGNKLEIKVDDSFFEFDFFFEKFMAIFIYNLQDFGKLYLNEIDIRNSDFTKMIEPVSVLNDVGGFLKGTIFKPYFHLSLKEKLEQIALFMSEGINVLKNDECYIIPQKELIRETDAILRATNNKAFFAPNITGCISDEDLVKELVFLGAEIFMVDFLITGLSPIARLKKKFPQICVWGHRIGFSAIDSYISMQALSVLAVLCGIDCLHIGTPISTNIMEKKSLCDLLWELKPGFLPVFTKTTPEILKLTVPEFDKHAIYLSCGYFRNKHGNIDTNKIKMWNKYLKKND